MRLAVRWVVALFIGAIGALVVWFEMRNATMGDGVRAAAALGSGALLAALTMFVLPRREPFDPTHGEQQRVVESGH